MEREIMPLAQAKCTNCGANLEIDDTKDAAICPYCGTAFIVEKAINNYNTTNQIHADTVNIYGGNSADFVIRGGVLEKYNGATTVVVVPNSVKTIGAYAFMNCIGITSVVLPDSVQEIGDGSFAFCAGLTSVTISNSVQKIGSIAFENCSSLTSVIIPDSVQEIGSGAFSECRSLTSVTIPNSVQSIGEFAFGYCSSLTSVTIPDFVQKIEKSVFCGCRSLASVTIPDSVQVIGKEAFYRCRSLISVVFSDSVQTIGEKAFCGCRSLTSVCIPSSVKHISKSAFSDCTALHKVKIDGVPEIDIGAFDVWRIQIVEASKACKKENCYAFECLKGYRPGEDKGACYVATAVYGSYDCPEVWTLRRFRDDTLDRTWYGRAFIRAYYAVSPTLVRWFGTTDWFRSLFKAPLDRFVRKLRQCGVQDTPYQDKY